MNGPADSSSRPTSVGQEMVKLLVRMGDLADRATAALDAGDTEAALRAIELRTELFDRERSRFERQASTQAGVGGRLAGDGAVDLYDALRDALRRHALLTERLREASGEVENELARLDAGRRSLQAYGRADLLQASARDGERAGT